MTIRMHVSLMLATTSFLVCTAAIAATQPPSKAHPSSTADAPATPSCTGTAFIPATAVGKRRLLGETKVAARAITNSRWFETECNVPLTKVPTADKECRPAQMPNLSLEGAEMAIKASKNQPGLFDLTLQKKGSATAAYTFTGLQAAPFESRDAERSTDYLVGEDSTHLHKVFVYFEDSLPSGAAAHSSELAKKYRIQIYFREAGRPSYLCASHMPDASTIDGFAGDDGIDQEHKAKHILQGGVGEGTEPRK